MSICSDNSVFDAGPMVQTIFARRGGAVSGEIDEILDELSLMMKVGGNILTGKLRQSRNVGAGSGPAGWHDRYFTAPAANSLPNSDRGNKIALNSAPIRMTREIKYIQTSSAMAAPSEP